MANYTIELKDIVKAGHNIFDFPYEFFDEKRRRDFERNFIRHFYFREIGCESVDRFKLYLEDKMQTVFPYYNKLFEAAKIEYSILDNYNMTESTTTTRENTAKSAGVSHSVGQIFEEQSESTRETRNANTEGTTSENVSDTSETSRNVTSEKTRNGTSEEKVQGSGNLISHTVTEEATTTAQEDLKKYLDTPQGAVTLTDSKYLTDLHHDTANGTKSLEGSVDGTETTMKNDTTNTTTEDSETVTDTESGNKTDTRTASGSTTGKEDFEATASGSMTGEQRNTADNNTRLESIGNEVEKIEHSRRGNIGIDTDSDMIQKHIKLQKILKRIELMFFDECEDLFMLVY